jgi:hypothetical protein
MGPCDNFLYGFQGRASARRNPCADVAEVA